MTLNKKYFYITVHFSPDFSDIFKCIDGNIYMNNLTGEKFEKRLLYDFGWGQEYGLERLPRLTFGELIELVEGSVMINKKRMWTRYSQEEKRSNDISQSNLFGAISVIMQDHIEEFIEFLSEKIVSIIFQMKLYAKIIYGFRLAQKKCVKTDILPAEFLQSLMRKFLMNMKVGKKYPKRLLNKFIDKKHK